MYMYFWWRILKIRVLMIIIDVIIYIISKQTTWQLMHSYFEKKVSSFKNQNSFMKKNVLPSIDT